MGNTWKARMLEVLVCGGFVVCLLFHGVDARCHVLLHLQLLQTAAAAALAGTWMLASTSVAVLCGICTQAVLLTKFRTCQVSHMQLGGYSPALLVAMHFGCS